MTVRRLKTYTAETGRTYEHYFVGSRPALEHDPFAPATEYIFDAMTEQKPRFAVSVFLTSSAVDAWQDEHGRELVDAEKYAAAKMKLMRGLDAEEDLIPGATRLLVHAQELSQLLAELGVD